MKPTKKTLPARLPTEVYKDLDNALNTRFKNNLINRRDLTFSEGFRLIRRMPEWRLALDKLKNVPKKEDMTGVLF